MTRLRFLLAAFLGAHGYAAQPGSSLAIVPIAEPEKAGQELAAQLRAKAPPDNSRFTGTLRILLRGAEPRLIPVTCVIRLSRTGCAAPAWEAVYQTRAAAGTPAEYLLVRFQAGRSNEYFLARGEAAAGTPGESCRVPNEKTEVPLAGSDFWLADLGLEFLHWPTQRVLRAEMSRGQICRVLESVNPQPAPAGYARVVSWVAREEAQAEGILQAEAYDQNNRLLKEFSLGSFKKVEGQWQLQDMKISNVQTRSRTWLEFDLGE